jgi:hypothetical protein
LHACKLPDGQNELWQVGQSSAKLVYKSEKEISVYSFPDKKRFLVLENAEIYHLGYTDEKGLAVLDTVKGTRLPTPIMNNGFNTLICNDNEVIYASDYIRPNITRPEYQETFLCLNRIDLNTNKHRVSFLDGFWSEQTLNPKIFTSDPDQKFQFKSFEGDLKIDRGHDDWVILNHTTNSFGIIDIAWVWNTKSNQLLKVPKKDLTSIEKPTIHYFRKLGRYIANVSNNVYLLREFDQYMNESDISELLWN